MGTLCDGGLRIVQSQQLVRSLLVEHDACDQAAHGLCVQRQSAQIKCLVSWRQIDVF